MPNNKNWKNNEENKNITRKIQKFFFKCKVYLLNADSLLLGYCIVGSRIVFVAEIHGVDLVVLLGVSQSCHTIAVGYKFQRHG